MDRLPADCVHAIIDGAVPRPSTDGLDVDAMLARGRALCGLALVNRTFRACAEMAMSEFVLLRRTSAVDGLAAAIDDGRVDASRIRRVTLSSIVPDEVLDGMKPALADVLRRELQSYGVSGAETQPFLQSVLDGIDQHLTRRGGSVTAHRPFCQAFARLRPRLTGLAWLQVDGYRSLCRAPMALWPLPAAVKMVVPPHRSVRHDGHSHFYEEEDGERFVALLEHSPGTRLHLQILSNHPIWDPDTDVHCTWPLWRYVHSMEFGSASKTFGGPLLWREGVDGVNFPSLRQLRLHLRPMRQTTELVDYPALRQVQELSIHFGLAVPGTLASFDWHHLEHMTGLESVRLVFDFKGDAEAARVDDAERAAALAASFDATRSLVALKSIHIHVIQSIEDGPFDVYWAHPYEALRRQCDARGIVFRSTSATELKGPASP